MQARGQGWRSALVRSAFGGKPLKPRKRVSRLRETISAEKAAGTKDGTLRNSHSLDEAERREASKSDPGAEARGLQNCGKGLRETVCPRKLSQQRVGRRVS